MSEASRIELREFVSTQLAWIANFLMTKYSMTASDAKKFMHEVLSWDIQTLYACIRNVSGQVNNRIIPFDPKALNEFFERYIKEKNIQDPEKRRRIFWAMFYAAKEGRPWKNELQSPFSLNLCVPFRYPPVFVTMAAAILQEAKKVIGETLIRDV